METSSPPPVCPKCHVRLIQPYGACPNCHRNSTGGEMYPVFSTTTPPYRYAVDRQLHEVCKEQDRVERHTRDLLAAVSPPNVTFYPVKPKNEESFLDRLKRREWETPQRKSSEMRGDVFHAWCPVCGEQIAGPGFRHPLCPKCDGRDRHTESVVVLYNTDEFRKGCEKVGVCSQSFPEQNCRAYSKEFCERLRK